MPILESAVPLLLKRLETESPGGDDAGAGGENAWTIAFPDQGAFIRYNSMFASFETIICMKVPPLSAKSLSAEKGETFLCCALPLREAEKHRRTRLGVTPRGRGRRCGTGTRGGSR